MKTYFLFLFSFVTSLFLSCEKEKDKPVDNKPVEINLPLKSAELIQQSNNFGIELFKKTSETEDKNLMLSPLSASTALSMLLNGCQGGSFREINQMLGFGNLTIGEVNNIYKSLVYQLLCADKNVKIALANAVWYDQNFVVKPPFLDSLQTIFSARTESLDFSQPQILNTINTWASDKTFGKIPKVLDEISADAVMFLMNALYFKGTWTYQFSPDLTQNMPFYKENGEAVNVPTMNGTMPVKTYYAQNFRALELPYGRKNFSMLILVPGEESLNNFIQNFDSQEWENLTQNIDLASDTEDVEVSIPKFKFSYEKVLNDQLQILGMNEVFSPELANLSGISDAPIFVSFVKQNTFVEVNEEGTEAAAVTTIGIELTSMPNSFYVNKAFVFVIRERTSNTILFIGKVLLPE